MHGGVAPTRCVRVLAALLFAWNLALPGRAAEVVWRGADYLVLAEHSALRTSRALTDALDARGVGYRAVVLPAADGETVVRDWAAHRTAAFHGLLAVGPCTFGADAAPRSIWSGLSLAAADVDALLAAQVRHDIRLLRVCSDWGFSADAAGSGEVASLTPDWGAAERSNRLLLSLGYAGTRHRAGIRPRVLAAAQGALRLTPLRLRFNDSAAGTSAPALFHTASAMTHSWDVGGAGADSIPAAAARAQGTRHPSSPAADGVIALTGRDSDGRRFALLSFATPDGAGPDPSLPAPGDEALALLLAPALRWLAAGAYTGVHRLRLGIVLDDALAPAPTVGLDTWGIRALRLDPSLPAPRRTPAAWPVGDGSPAARWASPGSLPPVGGAGEGEVHFPTPAVVAARLRQATAAQRSLAEALRPAGDVPRPAPFVTVAVDGAWLRNATPAVRAAREAALLGWALYVDLGSTARAIATGGPRGDALDGCIATARTVNPDAPLSVPDLLRCALAVGLAAAEAAGDLLRGENATVALPCAQRWGGACPGLHVEQALGAFLAASAPNANATLCGEELRGALRAGGVGALLSAGVCPVEASTARTGTGSVCRCQPGEGPQGTAPSA